MHEKKDAGIYYEYWVPRQSQVPAQVSSIDNFRQSAGNRIASARSTIPSTTTTTTRPTTTRTTTIRTTTTTRTTEAVPLTTALPTALPEYYQNSTEINLANFEEYEPQPTAASLIRAPPRMMTYRNIFAPFFNPVTTVATPTTTTSTTLAPSTTVTATIDKFPARNGDGSKSSNGSAKVDRVRSHLGLVHKNKKHSKSTALRSGTLVVTNNKSCSIDGSCWKTVNGKKHFCISEFGRHLLSY